MINVTVSHLKKIIKNVPDNAIITYERISDNYFEEHGWTVEVVENKEGIFEGVIEEYLEASVCYYDKEKNKLRITAHF